MNVLIITDIVYSYSLIMFLAFALGMTGLALDEWQIIEHLISLVMLIYWRQSFVNYFAEQNQHEKDFGRQ